MPSAPAWRSEPTGSSGDAPPFLELLYALREAGVPVTTHEWFTLLEGLEKGLAGESLLGFYHLARAVCCHGEHHYDAFDQAFLHVYGGLETPPEIRDEFADWLARELADVPLPPDIRELIDRDPADLEDLLAELAERLAEQSEEHHGGSKWVGTGGTSPFGWGGEHPAGVRIGGPGGGRSAIQIAAERRFRGYRSDRILDVRQLQVALKRLRRLSREGRSDELDIERTIDRTARNAGDIELAYRRSRDNELRLLLLMDVGGSMTPFAKRVEALFSAADGIDHFRSFDHYSFHNCVYGSLWTDVDRSVEVSTEEVLREHPPETRVIFCGDACMAWTELMRPYGNIDYFDANETPGVDWLRRIDERYPHAVWLNPIREAHWDHPTIRAIGEIFPMVPLTLDGLTDAVDILRKDRR